MDSTELNLFFSFLIFAGPMKTMPNLKALENQIRVLNKFPDQNPNPVLKVAYG